MSREPASRMPDDDPFTIEEDKSGYDEDKFYTAAREVKGFSATKRVNIPPNLSSAISVVVASPKIPEIRTEADFVRDALVHNMYRCSRIMKDRGMDSEEMHAAAEELRIETLNSMLRNRGERINKMIIDARESIHSSPDRERRRKEIIDEFSMWPDTDERLQLLREFQ